MVGIVDLSGEDVHGGEDRYGDIGMKDSLRKIIRAIVSEDREALAILSRHKPDQPTALWKCDRCLFTAYEGAVEDPGYISMHIDPDTDERCVGRMLRYELVRRPKYPDPEYE